MTHYMRDGNRYQVAPPGMLDITELLPLGTYKVGYVEPIDRYFLEQIDDFTKPGKIYGDTIQQRDRILRTFDDRPATTGVLLSGEKGSGKTLLATLTALEAQEKGIPTLVINQAYSGDTFNSFIQSIEQPTVVIFDEFEKTYTYDQQEKLLTLLDGTYTSKKLFILTCNDKYKVNEHMRNRPGRLFYRFDFGGLDVDFIRAYCGDNLERKDRIDEICRASLLFARFNFDILKAVVQEMNRYDESVEDVLKVLNAKPELGEKVKYTVSLATPVGVVPAAKMYDGAKWKGNPLVDAVRIHYYGPDKPSDQEEDIQPWDIPDGMHTAEFLPSDLKQVDAISGAFKYENAKGFKATLTETAPVRYDYGVVY